MFHRAALLPCIAVSSLLGCSEAGTPDLPVSPPEPSQVALTLEEGAGQAVEPMVRAEPLVFRALDDQEAAKAGLPVTVVASMEETGIYPEATQLTDNLGRATFELRAPPKAGRLEVTASAPRASSASVDMHIVPGPSASLEVQLAEPAIRLGESFLPELTVRDRYGNVTEAQHVEIEVLGDAAVLRSSGRLEAVRLGKGEVVVRADGLEDIAAFMTFGRAWRHDLTAPPLKLRILPNGDMAVLTREALQLRDRAGLLRWSTPMPASPGHLALDHTRNRAYVSLTNPGLEANVVAVDLATGAAEIWQTDLKHAGFLTYDPSTDLLVVLDNSEKVCLMPVSTHICEIREVGNLPSWAAVDPVAEVVLVSNHTSFDATLLYLNGRSVTLPALMNPFGVAVDTQRHVGLVANAMDHDVTVVDLAKGELIGHIPTGDWSLNVLVDQDRGRAVVNHAFGEVVWLDLGTLEVVKRIEFPHNLLGITMGLKQKTVLLTPGKPGLLLAVSLDDPKVLPSLTPAGQVVEAATLPSDPFTAVITRSPSGLELHRLPIPSN